MLRPLAVTKDWGLRIYRIKQVLGQNFSNFFHDMKESNLGRFLLGLLFSPVSEVFDFFATLSISNF